MKDTELRVFCEGNCYEAYRFLGSFPQETGVQFTLWAPNALQVQVVGTFNHWNGSLHTMHLLDAYGIWTLTVPEACVGDAYQYRILTRKGQWVQKADPFALQAALRPQRHSVVSNFLNAAYTWKDADWMENRKSVMAPNRPMHIYEMHCSTFPNMDFQSLAKQCLPYLQQMHYNFIELMPITEHPLDESWGYQTTGFYAVTSRYGTPEDFRMFVDACHQAGIGVILDWVPSHFAKDSHGLVQFDGTGLYEGDEIAKSRNALWGTCNFDFSKGEVQSFLLSSAFYFLEEFHVDGLRVDAVSNLLYHGDGNGGNRSYRNPALYNAYDGLENIDAIDFMKKLNRAVVKHGKGAITIAEESGGWERVTRPDYLGGLGFTYTWNMGWMHDTLSYLQVQPEYRNLRHFLIKDSLLRAFDERYCLSLSHDETVHGKGSLLKKMPGEQFAQLRVLLGYQMTHPGKKLTFMGNELGEASEWQVGQVRTPAVEQKAQTLLPMQEATLRYTKELNRIYMEQEALWSMEHGTASFSWVDGDNSGQSIVTFLRHGKEQNDFLLVVLNFSNVSYEHYKVGVPRFVDYRELLNSDAAVFGGGGTTNTGKMKPVYETWNGQPFYIELKIPANSMLLIKPIFEKYTEQEGGEG